jgi:spore maturation protein CgeB
VSAGERLPGAEVPRDDAYADPAGTAEAEMAALRRELADVHGKLAVAENMLAERQPTRLGLVARILRAAAKDPVRRRRIARDVGRALLDRMPPPTLPSMGRGMKTYPLPEFAPPQGPSARPGLTVAVILDPFSELALGYEWEQVTFGPDDWRENLEARVPALLFVESAWNGNDGRWRLHMTRQSRPSDQLRSLVAWCIERDIPTVFWNKEDPPNYERFIETAKLFDYVFTVDADRIPSYHGDLGHDRVALLPFGAQPRIHNPVRRGQGRAYDVAFAGSYFAEKHEDRRAQMDYVLDPAREFGLHIYSRFEANDERYRFPERYRSHIVGSLPYEQMLAAYTSYRLFLNVNSVVGSPTMCARRLFELSAAQTAVVSAPAASIPRFFGEHITVVEDAEQTTAELTVLLSHDEFRERRALRAHRRVFDEHLYSHRVDTVLRTVGIPTTTSAPTISVVVPTNRPRQLDNVFEFVGRQSHEPVELVLVQHGFSIAEDELRARAKASGVGDLVIRVADATSTLGACMNLGVEAAAGEYIAKMDDDNWYGPHYLRDLVRAFSYTDADVVGKWAHLVYLQGSGATLLRFGYAEHRYVNLVQGGTIIVRRSTAADLGFEELPRRIDTTFLDKVRSAGGSVYSTDRFNFVSVRRADALAHTWTISEEEILAKKADLLFYGEPYVHAEV